MFDEGSFVPQAKITNEGTFSIISDYLGTPIMSFDEKGNKVWERELDIYGNVRKGDSTFVPFLYQGQYYDEETELAYNRFRYYSPDTGTYISQDPIGLQGSNPNFYAYTFDSNTEVDPFGLDCSEAEKIQNEISQKTSSVSAAVTRWLKSSDTKWAELYRGFADTNPNFAKLIKGRIIDRRMNKWMKGKYEDLYPGSSFDKRIPGSGRMRPDAYFPNLDGQSAIFDIGGSTKKKDIIKYNGLANNVVAIIWSE